MKCVLSRIRELRLRDGGFTVIEAMVAVTILAIAIILTVGPMVASMNSLETSKARTVAENLAQGRIEEIRGIPYRDVGLDGFSVSGFLEPSYEESVGGRTYVVDTQVSFAGSATGLDVIPGPQQGDGVPGVNDPGVDYKYVIVTVAPKGHPEDALQMESIIAPPSLGSSEQIGNLRVIMLPHEPYGPYAVSLPQLQAQAAPNPAIKSLEIGATQTFLGLDPDTYTVSMFVDNGWRFHPDDVAAGNDVVVVDAGQLDETVIRIYRPATLVINLREEGGGPPITNATIVLYDPLTLSPIVTGSPGQTVFSNLVPQDMGIAVTAPGYLPITIADSIVEQVAGPGTDSKTVDLEMAIDPNPSVVVTFHVFDNYGTVDPDTRGALVRVTYPDTTVVDLYTDGLGNATLSIPQGMPGTFSVTASTEWGHTPDSANFTVGFVDFTVELSLERQSSLGRAYLNGIGPGYIEYRLCGSSWWSACGGWWTGPVPANDAGEATFVGPDRAYYQIRRHCDAPSPGAETKKLYLNNNTTTGWTFTSC
jgi:type II secretory pathway pseudopilin PulG